MKSLILTAVMFAWFSLALTGQNQGPITNIKTDRTTNYQQNGKFLTQKELAEILKSNMESAKQYNKREGLSKTGAAFVGLGFLSGCGAVCSTTFALKAHIDGNNDKASRLITGSVIGLWGGLGLLTIGITLASSSETHLKKSINIYNNSLKTSKISNGKIYFGFSGKGVGFQLFF